VSSKGRKGRKKGKKETVYILQIKMSEIEQLRFENEVLKTALCLSNLHSYDDYHQKSSMDVSEIWCEVEDSFGDSIDYEKFFATKCKEHAGRMAITLLILHGGCPISLGGVEKFATLCKVIDKTCYDLLITHRPQLAEPEW
jgi:hypothetical protein